MAGDARAFLADLLLGYLNQNLLPFLEQIADQRNRCRFSATETAASAASSATAASAIPRTALTIFISVISRPRPRGTLRIACRRRRSANLHAGIDGAIAACFGVEHGLSFGLSFL